MRLEEQLRRFKNNLKVNLQKAAFVVENEMHSLVARDKGVLDESITSDQVIDRGNLLSVDVGPGNVGYERFVELGVKGQVFNYHRNGKIVYTGVGQHFISRALENTRLEVFNIIASTKK